MKNKIYTTKGIYLYTPIKLFLGRKVIDRNVCKNNLLEFKKILDNENLKFGLIFGTLLGAIREKNFIEYDEDVDVYVLDENKEKILSLLFIFKNHGFDVARYDGELLTIIKDNDYIDIYFFKKKFFKRRVCMQYEYYSEFFNKFTKTPFLGEMFNTPNNYKIFLNELYGKDWMIPKKDAHAEATPKVSRLEQLKMLIKKKLSLNIYNENYAFSKKFNYLYKQIENLKKNNEMYLIYGAGTVSNLIFNLIKGRIVTRIDMKSVLIDLDIEQNKIYSVENIKNIKYDKIIISVLGREKEITNNLTKKFNISKDRIITFNLEDKL